MNLARLLARPLMAAPFLTYGTDAVLHPGTRADAARPLVAALPEGGPLPRDPELFVRVNAVAMTGAALLFATGRMPRSAAAVLLITSVTPTLTEHPFWAEADPRTRRTQRRLFVRNLGLAGSALLAAVDTQGRPGLAWRTRFALTRAERRSRSALTRAERRSRTALAGVPVLGAAVSGD